MEGVRIHDRGLMWGHMWLDNTFKSNLISCPFCRVLTNEISLFADFPNHNAHILHKDVRRLLIDRYASEALHK
jgi:hypothetical protein